MSYKSEAEARTAGAALLKRMPKGWSLRVWDNMGWHICVHFKKFVSVYEAGGQPMRYHCLMGHEFAGNIRWSEDTVSKNPMIPVRRALNKAKADVLDTCRILRVCEASVEGIK